MVSSWTVLRTTGRWASVTAASVFVATERLATLSHIDGVSMEPCLRHGDRVLELRRDWARPLHRGQVLTLDSPVSGERLVKRLVGLEGDLVRPRPTSAARQASSAPAHDPPLRLEEGRLWLEGDNAARSAKDSNWLGPLHAGLVRGEVRWVLWPPSRFGPVDDQPRARGPRASYVLGAPSA